MNIEPTTKFAARISLLSALFLTTVISASARYPDPHDAGKQALRDAANLRRSFDDARNGRYADPNAKPLTQQQIKDMEKRFKEMEDEARQKEKDSGVEGWYTRRDKEAKEDARRNAEKERKEKYESKRNADLEAIAEEAEKNKEARKAQTAAMRQRQLAAYRYDQAQMAQVMKLRNAGKKAEAIALLEKLTAAGLPTPPYVLGTMYFKGDGVKVDKKKGVGLFYSAARNGSSNGSYALARAYFEGDGLSKSDKDAAQWLEASDAAGAQYLLGSMYLEGTGVSKNFDKAWQSFKSAAQQNDARAMASLGEMSYLGLGMQKSTVQAKRWFETAAKAKDPKAFFYLSQMYATGDGVEKCEEIGAEYMNLYKAAQAKLPKPTTREQQLALKDVNNMQSRMERLKKDATPASLPPLAQQPTATVTSAPAVTKLQEQPASVPQAQPAPSEKVADSGK